ncbi:ParB/Srx family N-terminal domain-containing protein [Kaistia sp. MMO-174]|uniref:ParB/Srx family N-terminal domain-containing protein n=1 Tax=Kaistia sp. MMO-174 TaxID=3081256 RepID=UPI00301A53F5
MAARSSSPAPAEKPGVPATEIEMWAVEHLVPYARNSKKHPKAQVQQLAASITEFGFTIPILAAEDGTIIAGHGRLLAAQLLGMKEVPVIVARGWTDEQRRAYTIADNKLTENGEWDESLLKLELGELALGGFDVGLIGFSALELDRIVHGGEGSDPKDEWNGMPEFDQTDKTAFRTLPIHFPDQAAVDRFAALIGQKITEKTRFAWYPEIEIETYADKRYSAQKEREMS